MKEKTVALMMKPQKKIRKSVQSEENEMAAI